MPVRSLPTVQAGALITSDSGVSGPAPAATTPPAAGITDVSGAGSGQYEAR